MFKNKVVWIIIAIVAILFFWVKGVYNNMVTQDEGVKTAWSQVENQYQRRMDLIPNLVNTVKGYAAHEKETLEGVVNARAEATKTTIANQNFMELQAQLEGTENRISVERKRFNEVAQSYNTYIRQFPNNILSGMFGFQSKAYFAAESGAEKAPKVEF